MGLIEIEGMEFYAYHGHFEAERIVGNTFLLDISLETDCSVAAQSDNLKDALNYQSVYELIKEEMKITSSLLEHVAQRIIESLYKQFPAIQKVTFENIKNEPTNGWANKKSKCNFKQIRCDNISPPTINKQKLLFKSMNPCCKNIYTCFFID